jgi:hypothetical protein
MLTAILPPLNLFREPIRAIRAAYFLLPILAITGLSLKFREINAGKRQYSIRFFVLFLALLIAFFHLPPMVREMLTWGAAALLVIFTLPCLRNKMTIAVPAFVLLLFFGAASVSAFKERLFPFPDSGELLDFPAQARDGILQTEPALSFPLSRSFVDLRPNTYHINMAMALGISSVEGYWHATSRFGRLYAALNYHPYSPTDMYFDTLSRPVVRRVLAQLYNVCCSVVQDGATLRVLHNLPPTAGSAWFPQAMSPISSFEELASKLIALGTDAGTRLNEKAWLVSGDPATASALNAATSLSACARARIVSATAANASLIHFRVNVPDGVANCPMAVAMNYQSNLMAVIDGKRLTTFPVYGALLGINAPGGSHEITIKPIASEPLWSRLAPIAGAIMVLICLCIV